MSKNQIPRCFFGVLIEETYSDDGGFLGYSIQSKNYGIEEEAVLTLMRNWLRRRDDDYYTNFSVKQA